MDFVVPANHKVKIKESEKIDKYLDLAWEHKKSVEHTSDDDTNSSWCPKNSPKGHGKEIAKIRNLWKNRYYPDHSFVNISYFT